MIVMSIQEKLDASIPPDCIASKAGLSYVSHRYVKQQLNEIFGWDGWSYTVERVELDRVRQEAFVHVRLTVFTDGGAVLTRDGLAVGFLPKPRDVKKHDTWANNAQGFDFAVAEALTDAIKRAAVSCGNSLGLELYPMVPKGQEKKAPKKTESKATRPAPKKKTTKKAVVKF
jgi:DNA repair and recombination protein RAD52